ncbi:Putative ribonuclease H protein At1g65750 [Linum grandiflorum]
MQSDSNVAAGGIIKDVYGNTLGAFAANLGRCTITRAGLRGAIFSLCLAWELGFWKVNLQLDSQCAVDALLGDPPYDFRHSSCIREAMNLLRRTWDVTVSHIFCEGNCVADALAHYGHS